MNVRLLCLLYVVSVQATTSRRSLVQRSYMARAHVYMYVCVCVCVCVSVCVYVSDYVLRICVRVSVCVCV